MHLASQNLQVLHRVCKRNLTLIYYLQGNISEEALKMSENNLFPLFTCINGEERTNMIPWENKIWRKKHTIFVLNIDSSMKWSLQLKLFAHFLFSGHVASLFQSPWAILAESSNTSPCLARHLPRLLFNYFPSKFKACASKSNISFSVPMHNVTPITILLCTYFSLLTTLELIQLLRKYNFHFYL